MKKLHKLEVFGHFWCQIKALSYQKRTIITKKTYWTTHSGVFERFRSSNSLKR